MKARDYLLLALCLLVPVCAFNWTGLTSPALPLPGLVDSDANLLFYPNRTFFQRCLANGELPLWNPHELLGYPMFASGQTGAFYPPNYLIYPWLPAARALFVDVTLHLVLFGLATAWLASGLKLGRGAIWVAALASALSPVVLLRVPAGHITVISTLAWLPAMAGGLVRMAGGDRKMIIPTALSLGLCLHAGHIQLLYYFLAFGAPAFLVYMVAFKRYAGICWSAIALLLGLGLGSIQWLATAELASHSNRTLQDMEWTLRDSTRPVELFTLLGPEFFGDRKHVPYWGRYTIWETNPSFGWVLILLAFTGLVLGPLRRTGPLFLLAVAGLLVAMGLDLPVQTWFSAWIPGFRSFRAHARILLLVLPVLGLLAGYGTEALATRRRPSLFLVLALLGGTLLAAAILVATAEDSVLDASVRRLYTPTETFDLVDFHQGSTLSHIRYQIAGLLARSGLLSLFLAGVASTGPRFPHAPLLILALLAEFAHATRRLNSTRVPTTLDAPARDYLAARPDGSRVQLPPGTVPTLPTLLGVDTPDGSVSIMLAWSKDLLRLSQGRTGPARPTETFILRRFDGLALLFGVSRAVLPLEPALCPPGLVQRNASGPHRFLAAEAPFPRAWISHHVQLVSSDQLLVRLLAPDFDPRRTALVTQPVPDVQPSSGADSVTLEARTANTLLLHAKLDKAGLLVINETHDPGWRATVDGQDAPIVPVDAAFRGIWLAPGSHLVRLRYAPRTLPLGLLATALAAAALLLFRKPS